MKKILILAYDFPPYVSVASLRPYSWYKHLKEFGIYPIVITRQWGNKYGNHLDYVAPGKTKTTIVEESEFGTIIKTPYKPNLANRILLKYGNNKLSFLRKAISAYYEIMQFLFPIGTKAKLYHEAKRYLQKNKMDAIIATGEPFVLFKYASLLGKKYKTPWIADYRDPWNIKDNKSFFRPFFAFFEKKYLKTANCCITVSEFFKFKTIQIIGNKKFHILPNGYSPDIVEITKNTKQTSDILSFAFAGSILAWHPYKSVLKIFNQLITKNPEIKIRLDFYGVNIANELFNLLEREFSNLKPHTTIYPKIPNDKLLKKIATYNVMLLFNYYSILGTKIYDYLATKRQILLCYSNDTEAIRLKNKYYPHKKTEGLSTHLQEDMIKENQAGIVVKDEADLYNVLVKLHTEFQENKEIVCNSVNTEQYSRKYQVEKLAELIKEIG